MALWESGQLQFWASRGFPQHDCLARTKSLRKIQTARLQVPIKLSDLMGTFLILGIGAGLATLVFLLEKIDHFRRLRMSATVVTDDR
jgi:hypothetical protein